MANSVVSTLISAYLLFAVGATITVAALGEDGEDVKWALAGAVALAIVFIGLTVTTSVVAAYFLLVQGAPTCSTFWKLTYRTAQGFSGVSLTVAGEYIPGWTGVIVQVLGFAVLIVAIVAMIWILVASSKTVPRQLSAASLWSLLLLSMFASLANAMLIGVILRRATT